MGSSAFLLSAEARGVYREMLTQAWRRGAQLPNNHEAIRRAAGITPKEWARSWPLIERYWRVEGETLVNDTQLVVYAEAKRIAERNIERSRKGGRAKAAQASAQAHAQADVQALPKQLPKQCPPSPSPSPIVDPTDLHDRAREAQRQNTPIFGKNPHLAHVLCDSTHSYCVPRQVHDKLADLLAPKFEGDREAAKGALLDWYKSVWAKLAPGFVMGEAFRFWQGRFDESFASPAPAARKPTRLAEAMANIRREVS